ncbi:hypothetical protein AB0J80_36270 [Actinoplanes sp. NPDC049548]|uniref:hypothetical protein n=1 Tax=Actinoplanes sp. NPDC049548 TaxID=3155152 RepID=UPI003417F390
MSIEAINWVLTQAPDLKPHLFPVLLGMANHAHPDGTGAYASIPTLAGYARKTERAVINDVQELLGEAKPKKVKQRDGSYLVVEPEQVQLIERGDQRLVAHIPVDRRPVVYNLLMHKRRDGGVIQPTPRPQSGRSAIVPGQPTAGGTGSTFTGGAARPVGRANQCKIHPGWFAHNCGGCKVDALVGGAA